MHQARIGVSFRRLNPAEKNQIMFVSTSLSLSLSPWDQQQSIASASSRPAVAAAGTVPGDVADGDSQLGRSVRSVLGSRMRTRVSSLFKRA